MCVELPSSPPGGSTWLEEVVDEGKARGSEGRRWATCTWLRMNSRHICGAERGGKCVYLGRGLIEKISGGIHHLTTKQATGL